MQGASPGSCQVDGDCPSNLVCYQRTLSFTGNQSYCLCATWYGWTLTSSSPSLTNTSNCELTTLAIFAIACFGAMCFILFYRLIVLLRTMRVLDSKAKIQQNLSFTATWMFTLVWIVVALIRSAFLAKEFASPQKLTLTPFGPSWKYSSVGVYRTRPLLVVMIVFNILVDYQLIMVWFNAAINSSRVSRGTNHNISRRYQQILQAIVICLEITFIIGASITIAQDEMSGFLNICTGFFLIVLIGYAVAGIKLHRLLSEAIAYQLPHQMANIRKLKTVAWTIRLTATANSVLVLLSLVTSIVAAETIKVMKEVGFLTSACQIVIMFLTVCQIWVTTFYLSSVHGSLSAEGDCISNLLPTSLQRCLGKSETSDTHTAPEGVDESPTRMNSKTIKVPSSAEYDRKEVARG